MIGPFARNRPQPAEPEERERDHVRCEPLPVARAILWKPLPDSYHLLASMMRAREQQAHLFISQRAFLQVERHLGSAPDLELGGFLAGHLCECPRSRMRYAIINTVVPFADVTGDPLGSRVTQKAYDAVRRRLEAHGLALVGWYRNGNGLGLQLLPDDIETHVAYFNEPWQTTMLVAPDASKPKGAFFTYDPRVGRGYCMPFYELFDAHAAESKRLDRTCVSWTTYVASAPVQPLTSGDREIVEMTVSPLRSEPEPEPPEPIDEWLDAIKDPWLRLKDVTVRSTPQDVPIPLVYEIAAGNQDSSPTSLDAKTVPTARSNGSSAPTEKRREPNDSINAPPASAAESSAPPRVVAVGPAPPFAGPGRQTVAPPPRPTPPPARPVMAPSPPERQSRVGGNGSPSVVAPGPRPRPSQPAPRLIPAATAAAMTQASTQAEVPPLPNPQEEKLRWQRRRRIGFAIAAISFLAAIAFASLRSRPQRVAEAATIASTPARTSAPAVVARENDGAPIALPSAVDSLSRALAYYRTVADDRRAGRVDCHAVDRAYALVERARQRVDSSRRRVSGRLSDADSIRVSMLSAEYTYVAQTYRRSGCRV